MGKVIPFSSLGLVRSTNAGKLVLCCGVFDLLHPGHHTHLREAKSLGDKLLVLVTPDKYVNRGPGKPTFREALRAQSVSDLKYVDYVVINEYPTAVEAIKLLRPNIYCKGKDYKESKDDLTGKIDEEIKALEEIGGQFQVTNTETYSATHLINENLNPYPEEVQKYISRLKERHTAESIISGLQRLRDLKVLVVGDAIIDIYCYCNVLGASPKSNIMVVEETISEAFAGGVLAVANHIAGFCDKVHLITRLGSTESGIMAMGKIRDNITCDLIYEGEKTTTKTRLVEPDSMDKLFEVCNINYIDSEAPLEKINEVIRDYDIVIACDFGHGFINSKLAHYLSFHSKFLTVNCQTNAANLGFNPVTKFTNPRYISIDELELRIALQDKLEKTDKLVDELRMDSDNLVISITLGRRGSSIYSQKGKFSTPCLSKEVVDTVGAGDAYFSITSLCAARGWAPELIGFIGNAVGALKVKTVCNKEPINPIELYKFIKALMG